MSITVKNTGKNPNNIRALALDLDGTTLAPGAVLSERTIRAVKKCSQKGLRIIIATGRALESVEPYRKSLAIEGPVICFNGALVTDMPKGDIISCTLLNKEAVEFCVDLSREMGAYFQAFFPSAGSACGTVNIKMPIIAERDGPELDFYYANSGLRPEIADLKEILRRPGLKGCLKVMFIAESEAMAVLRPKLDEHFGGSAYIAKTMPTYLEIMNAEVSKGQALKLVMEHYSLRSEEVIAFGDEENDLPMFAAAGFSVAPSNAKENVKSAANMIVDSNADDGVAAFLEDFFGLGTDHYPWGQTINPFSRSYRGTEHHLPQLPLDKNQVFTQ